MLRKSRQLQSRGLFCHTGHLGVTVGDNNYRSIVTQKNGLAHSSIQCTGPVPQSCGDLETPSAECSSKNCPCVVQEAEKLLWADTRALAAHALQRCETNSSNVSTNQIRFLNIGLGAGGIAMAVAQGCPHAQLESIELDSTMVDLARGLFGFKGRVEVADALVAVRNRVAAGESYDVVMIDCFDDEGVAPSCRNDSFIQALVSLVKSKRGVIAQHVWGNGLLPVYRRHFHSVRLEFGGAEPIIVATV